MDFNSFIYEFFVRPVMNPGTQGYNIVNTAVYGIILMSIAFFVVFPLLHKRGIKFNYKFCLALIPYILIGTTLRVINSGGLIEGIGKTVNPLEMGFWTFTPGVWILIFVISVIGILIGRFLKENSDMQFEKGFALFGTVIAVPLLLFLFSSFTNWPGFLAASLLIAIIIGLIYFVLLRIPRTRRMANAFTMLVVSGQVIDSTATGFAIHFYGFIEQHPLSDAILNISPALFLVLKVVLVLVIIDFVEKEIKNKNLRGFIVVFLAIMGLATGIASLLKIGLV